MHKTFNILGGKIMAAKITTSQFVLSPKECGAYLGLSENTIRLLCKEGKIKAAKSGKNYKIPKTVTDPAALTLDQVNAIIEESAKTPAKPRTTRRKKA